MKKRFSLGKLSVESFDESPVGNVLPQAQGETPEQPLVTAGYTETPFSGSENYAAEVYGEKFKQRALEAIANPPYPLRRK